MLALGEPARLAGYALAGVVVVGVGAPDEVRRAWDRLPREVALVLLTPEAAAAVGERREQPDALLSVVLPR